jgi:transcriptional regulator with XRE-family HTH domain
LSIEQAFGVVLRDLRKANGLSQEGLAERSGFHRTYISLLERGLKSPTLTTINRLCQTLSIPPHQFLFLVGEELSPSIDKTNALEKP